ncbi:MAG TPA: DUF4199 domain-containing protein [Candidatus Angelobacter sp.]
MKKTIITFGFISGAILSALMLATIPFADRIGFDKALVVGYTTIVLAFLLVFFGIKAYRDNVGGGQITFTRAFVVGISITVISSLCYVVSWEILYYNFMHGFMDKYAAYLVGKLQASGASAAKIADQLQEMKRYKELYENPLWNGLFTFIEPFPVGLVITLISAAVLRRKQPSQPAEATLAAQL